MSDPLSPAEAIAELEFDLRGAESERDEAEARVALALALHQPSPWWEHGDRVCERDHEPWPCVTARALGADI